MNHPYDARRFRLRAIREAIRCNLVGVFPALLDVAGYAPLTANLRITHRCSSRCQTCNYPSTRGGQELSTEQWKGLILDLKDNGVMQLNFTGGDIFLRSDLYELLDYAVRVGFRVKCAINGLTVSKQAAERLMRSNLDAVAVSLDDLSGEYDRIRGAPDAARRAQRCIEWLREFSNGGTHLRVAATIMKSTLTAIPGVVEFAIARDLSVEFNIIHFNHYFLDTSFSREQYRLGPVEKEQLRELLRWLEQMYRRYPQLVPRLAHLEWIGKYFDDYRQARPPCYQLMLKLCVEPNGDVRSCCSNETIGNMHTQDLRAILVSPRNIAQVKSGLAKKCPGCACHHNLNLDASFPSHLRERVLNLGFAKVV